MGAGRWIAAVALGLAAGIGAAAAQGLTAGKPVTLIVNNPPGGPSDILARMLAPPLAARLERSVVVENKAGATGVIGATAAGNAAPDGHTLLFAIDAPFTVTPTLQPGLLRTEALRPLVLLASSGLTVTLHPGVPATSMAALIALGRRAPLTFSSGGNGSPGHLAAAILMDKRGVQVLHVPYKGNTPAVTALIQAEAQAGILATTGVLPHIQAGKLRALATTGERRAPLLPDLPTVGELGMPELAIEVLYLALVPAGTPEPLATRLGEALTGALALPDIQAKLAQLDFTPVGLAGPAVAARIAATRERYAGTIRATGMQAD